MKNATTRVPSGRLLCAVLVVMLGMVPGTAWTDTPPERAPVISAVVFTIKDRPQDALRWQRLAADIWPMTAGEVFSAANLKAAVEALKQSGLFQEIAVNSRERGDTLVLDVGLLPFDRIRDIRIRGAYPLFEKDILNVMTLSVGGTYVAEDLPVQVQNIESLFKQQGYPLPRVSITARRLDQGRRVIIQIDIHRGPHLSVGQITITGNRSLSDAYLKARLKTWRRSLKPGSAGRFIAEDLTQDARRLRLLYRKLGYLDAVVDYRVERDATTHRIKVYMTVSEGSRYTVAFEGNQAFSHRRLKKEMVMFHKDRSLETAIRESIRGIRNLYAEKGFVHADISLHRPTRTQIGDRPLTDRIPVQIPVQILVRIQEGPQTNIGAIHISGNRSIATRRIRTRMLSRPAGLGSFGRLVPAILSEDLSSIRALYLAEGFTAARIEKEILYTPSRQRADIRIHIDEGLRTRVASVLFTGLSAVDRKTALRAIGHAPEGPFRQYMLTSDENTLSAIISERGYPHVQVSGEVRFGRDGRQAHITYRVDQGPLVRVGVVDFTGHFKTRAKVLERVFSQKPNGLFSLKKTLKETDNLRKLEVFEKVHVNTLGLDTRADTVNLLVNVTERKPYYLEAGGGYASDKGFFAHAKTGDRNLFGLNKSLWIEGTVGQTGHRISLGLSEPRLFGSRILADLGAHSERLEAFNQTFGTTLHGGNLKLSTRILSPFSLGCGLRWEYRDQFRRIPCQRVSCDDDPLQFKPRSLLAVTPSLLYDSRNSFIRPRRGLFSALSADISRGLKNSLDDFVRYRLDVRAFFTPLERLTLALRGQAGYIDTYGDALKVPDDQLFFLGGVGNVRGFAENRLRTDADGKSVGGRQAISASLETRIDLGFNLELALFMDTGHVDKTFLSESRDGWRWSIGGGLRYITPIGPLGLIYGHKLDPLDSEGPGYFHFSIGYTF